MHIRHQSTPFLCICPRIYFNNVILKGCNIICLDKMKAKFLVQKYHDNLVFPRKMNFYIIAKLVLYYENLSPVAIPLIRSNITDITVLRKQHQFMFIFYLIYY